MILGHLLVVGLALYWYAWRPAVVKRVDAYMPGLTQKEQLNLDSYGPHSIETELSGLDYVVRSVYYQQAPGVVRYQYVVLLVPILVVLATGALAAVFILLSSLGSLRWREPAAVRRARHTIESS